MCKLFLKSAIQNFFKTTLPIVFSIFSVLYATGTESSSMISDSSFEKDGFWQMPAANSGAFVDNAPHSGQRCVDLSLVAGGPKYRMVLLSNKKDNALKLQPNSQYELELWARAVGSEKNSGRIRTNFYASGYDFPYKDIIVKADCQWQKYNVVLETKDFPEDKEMFLRIWTLDTGNFFIDDVRLSSGIHSIKAGMSDKSIEKIKPAAQFQLKEITKQSSGKNYAVAKSFLRFNYLPANVIDGNLNTSWVSALARDQLIIGIGTNDAIPHLISGVKIFFGGKPRAPQNYSIKVSLDGITWETVAIRKNMEYCSERMEYFKPSPGWFVMLDIENTYQYFGASIREIEAFAGEHQLGQFLIDGQDKKTPDRIPLIASFQTEKALYKFNQPINAIAKFNFTGSNATRSVKLFQCSGLGSWQLLATKPLPENCNNIAFDIAPEQREYAHVLKLVLFENDNEIYSKMCLFEVCDDWAKILRPMSIPAYETFSAEFPDDGIKWHINKAKEYYFNTIEFYCGTPCYGALVPEQSPWAAQPTFSRNTFEGYNKWRKALEDAGIKRMHYHEVLSAWDWRVKKEWLAYTPVKLTEPEKIWTMWVVREKEWNTTPGIRIKGYPSISYSPNISSSGYVNYFSEQFSKAMELFDFDAMFLDDYTRACVLSSKCSDINGNPSSNKSPDEVSNNYLSAMEIAGKKISSKNIVFVGNNLAMGIEGEFQKPDFRQRVLNHEIKFPFPGMAGHNVVWVHESVMDLLKKRKKLNMTNYPYTYQDLSRMIQGIKQVAALKPMLWWDFSFGTIVNVKTLHAIALANGGGYANNIFEHIASENNAISQVIKNYLFFAVRYEEYMNAMDIKWLPDGVFECNVPHSVYWQDLCFEKNISPIHKQYYLHLINLPGNENDKKYDQITNVKNISIETKIPKGWQVSGIKLLSPDIASEPLSVEFKQIKPHLIQYTISELQVWDFIIIDMKK